MTQEQYDYYRTGANFGSLWSLGSSRGGTIDVSLPGSGRYFLVAQHGTSYEETAQVVRLTVHLSGDQPDDVRLGTFDARSGALDRIVGRPTMGPVAGR